MTIEIEEASGLPLTARREFLILGALAGASCAWPGSRGTGGRSGGLRAEVVGRGSAADRIAAGLRRLPGIEEVDRHAALAPSGGAPTRAPDLVCLSPSRPGTRAADTSEADWPEAPLYLDLPLDIEPVTLESLSRSRGAHLAQIGGSWRTFSPMRLAIKLLREDRVLGDWREGELRRPAFGGSPGSQRETLASLDALLWVLGVLPSRLERASGSRGHRLVFEGGPPVLVHEVSSGDRPAGIDLRGSRGRFRLGPAGGEIELEDGFRFELGEPATPELRLRADLASFVVSVREEVPPLWSPGRALEAVRLLERLRSGAIGGF